MMPYKFCYTLRSPEHSAPAASLPNTEAVCVRAAAAATAAAASHGTDLLFCFLPLYLAAML